MSNPDNPETGKDTTSTPSQADRLAALREQLAYAAGHPFVPGPVRDALPLLLGIIEQQQADITELQSALDIVTSPA